MHTHIHNKQFGRDRSTLFANAQPAPVAASRVNAQGFTRMPTNLGRANAPVTQRRGPAAQGGFQKLRSTTFSDMHR
jgi:hypothetical protein